MQLLLAVSVCATALSAALPAPVRTESGLVSGTTAADGMSVFRGIPYAAPPTGTNRWRPPEPPLKWSGIRNATQFGASCAQPREGASQPYTHEYRVHNELSEDCLFLNIWTLAQKSEEKRPVFVYIHGGSNTTGSASVDAYSGEGLARKGLVTVTINYRLGTFGFFTHPDLTKESVHHSSGNYGLLDQVAALQWIQRNIAAFGGDPGRVTVAGQSAGGFDISYLIVSPLGRGLFQRAIMQSGGAPGATVLPDLASSEQNGLKLARTRGASLDQLRKLPWQALVSPPVAFNTVVDGYLLPVLPKDLLAAGEEADIPTLAGFNADEYGASPHTKITVQQFQAEARRYVRSAQEFLNLYPAASDAVAAKRSNESIRDLRRFLLVDWAALRARGSKSPAYLYFYGHTLPGSAASFYGAFHAAEIFYVMNNLAQSDRPFTPADRQIADLLSSYWVNFATTGDPNGSGFPHWSSYQESPRTVMMLDTESGAMPVAGTPAKFEFWKRMFSPGSKP